MILVLNLGLKSVRAIVFDQEGNKCKSSFLPILTTLLNDRVEQDPNEWWDKSLKVIRESVDSSDIRNNIEAITVTSSSCCLVASDKHGNPLLPSLMVSDKRSLEQAAELSKNPHFKGIQTENQSFISHPSMMIPKIMWVKENHPNLFSKTCRFISSNDFLIERITGKQITDELNAEKFYYSIKNKSYPADLLADVGIPEKLLPEVLPIGSNIGKVRKTFLRESGFHPDQKIDCILSTYDAICAFFGSGVHKAGEACDVSGTVTSLRAFSPSIPKSKTTDIFAQHISSHNFYIIGGSNNLGGGLIEWAKQCFYKNEKEPYDTMEEEARSSSLGARGIIFLPYLLGERAPLWDNDIRATFFGLERHHNRKDIIRAVFESAGFSLSPLLKIIESSHSPIDSITISGGLSRIDFISQLKADILNKEIRIPEELETTSLGAFIITALSLKKIHSLNEARKILKIKKIISPCKEKAQKYSKLYPLYLDLYQTLKPISQERKKLLERLYCEDSFNIENL